MNPQKAAHTLIQKTYADPKRDSDGLSVEHAVWMLEGISEGYIQHEKAHRWLGYAQGILVSSSSLTLNDMKEINAAEQDDT